MRKTIPDASLSWSSRPAAMRSRTQGKVPRFLGAHVVGFAIYFLYGARKSHAGRAGA